MSVALDPPAEAGGVRVAVICRTRVLRAGAGIVGDKRPLAVLIAREDTVLAFAPDGAAMAPERVERLCPGALARFAAG